MKTETINAAGKSTSKRGACGCPLGGRKCPYCGDLLPTRASFCTGCWDGKQCYVSVILYRRSSAIPFGRVCSFHLAWVLSKQTRPSTAQLNECAPLGDICYVN